MTKKRCQASVLPPQEWHSRQCWRAAKDETTRCAQHQDERRFATYVRMGMGRPRLMVEM